MRMEDFVPDMVPRIDKTFTKCGPLYSWASIDLFPFGILQVGAYNERFSVWNTSLSK